MKDPGPSNGTGVDIELKAVRQGRELYSRLKGRVFTVLLRLLRKSWRVRIDGMETLNALYSEGRPFILCFWHGEYVPVTPLFEGYSATVLTSRSRRGDVLSRIFSNFGYDTIQIPDHGGEASMKLMEGMSAAPAAAVAVDGPLGPYHVVKRGVVRLASETGFLLLPVSLDARPRIVLSGRWDKLEIPIPFSRVHLTISPPIKLPDGGLSRKETDYWASRLAETLENMEAGTAREPGA